MRAPATRLPSLFLPRERPAAGFSVFFLPIILFFFLSLRGLVAPTEGPLRVGGPSRAQLAERLPTETEMRRAESKLASDVTEQALYGRAARGEGRGR